MAHRVDLILEYALSASTVAVSWSGHLGAFLAQLGVAFPAALSAAPGTLVATSGGHAVTAVFNLPAVLITAFVTVLLLVGIRESATVNAAMVALKVAVIAIVIAGASGSCSPATGIRSCRRTAAGSVNSDGRAFCAAPR